MIDIYSTIVAVYGLLVGSFLNAVIYRIPRNTDLAFRRSKCTSCSALIPWYCNIPLFSYLFLLGKCLRCKALISKRYPLIELLTSFLAVYLFRTYGAHGDGFLLFILYFITVCILICHFFIDLDFKILPDSLNIMLLILALIHMVVFGSYMQSLIGFAVGFGGTLLITEIFYRIKGQQGLGGGDIKLYGILGVFWGPQVVLNIIFMSCFLGSIVGIFLIVSKIIKKNEPIAFGPYIIVVVMLLILVPEWFYRLSIS